VLRPETAAATDAAARAEQNQALLTGFASGDVTQIITANLQALRMWWTPPLRTLVMQLNMFGAFLIGLYVGRSRVFENVAAHRARVRRFVVWFLPLGLLGSLLWWAVASA
jgi:hypothetical protein